MPEITRLAKTISAWEHKVLADHATGLSNGPTEAVNLLIEKMRYLAMVSAISTTIGSESFCAAW